jgi:hypothetical protein
MRLTETRQQQLTNMAMLSDLGFCTKQQVISSSSNAKFGDVTVKAIDVIE